MPFCSDRNNLLYEIFYNYPHLWHVIAHLGKIIFMRPYIMKRRRNFACPSVNQPMYTLMFKQRRQQLRNLVQRYWRKLLRRDQNDFFKNRSKFLKMILKSIFLDFSAKYSFISWFFSSLRYLRFTAPKFSIEILKRVLRRP